jgi:predicted DNA-binding transcriptional regulator AlpA
MKTKSKKGHKAKVAQRNRRKAARPRWHRTATAAPSASPLNPQRRLVWPSELQARYGISNPTRWRWERDGKLPPRDVKVGGVLVGWRPETLDAAERGQAAA